MCLDADKLHKSNSDFLVEEKKNELFKSERIVGKTVFSQVHVCPPNEVLCMLLLFKRCNDCLTFSNCMLDQTE